MTVTRGHFVARDPAEKSMFIYYARDSLKFFSFSLYMYTFMLQYRTTTYVPKPPQPQISINLQAHQFLNCIVLFIFPLRRSAAEPILNNEMVHGLQCISKRFAI